MEKIYVYAFKFDDYNMVDYVNKQDSHVNLYVVNYGSQSNDESAHLPRTCPPGGGWLINISLTQEPLAGFEVSGQPLRVNRVLKTKGDSTQFVSCWLQQRVRASTNEYMVVWYLFLDALMRQCFDGAMVRLVVCFGSGEYVMLDDKQLTDSVHVAVARLQPYIHG